MSGNGLSYNATVTDRVEVGPNQFLVRVRPDGEFPEFKAGQYAVLGLYPRERRCDECPEEEDLPHDPDRLILRAYSIASSSLSRDELEFYVTLVRGGALTARLSEVPVGGRLYLGSKAKGHFTLDQVPEGRDLVLIGTGTGLAPYMSMIRTAHRCGEGPKYVVLHGARYAADLGYREDLTALDHGCPNFAYIPTITRLDGNPGWTGHVGRVQSVIQDGTLDARLGYRSHPSRCHFFLCGSPEMVESTRRVLGEYGFEISSPRAPGSIHIERYW